MHPASWRSALLASARGDPRVPSNSSIAWPRGSSFIARALISAVCLMRRSSASPMRRFKVVSLWCGVSNMRNRLNFAA